MFVASLKEELVNCADQILALKILGEGKKKVTVGFHNEDFYSVMNLDVTSYKAFSPAWSGL